MLLSIGTYYNEIFKLGHMIVIGHDSEFICYEQQNIPLNHINSTKKDNLILDKNINPYYLFFTFSKKKNLFLFLVGSYFYSNIKGKK